MPRQLAANDRKAMHSASGRLCEGGPTLVIGVPAPDTKELTHECRNRAELVVRGLG